jgi:hypothetical protein
MGLAGHVQVNNKSGEDYENAQVRLVVGNIRLVEEIAAIAVALGDKDKFGLQEAENLPTQRRMSLGRVLNESLAERVDFFEKKKEIVREALSEYFLYTVEGRDTIPTGWAKRLPSFQAADVPITSYYKFEKERWDQQVIRFYKFKNDKASKLGNEPLPDGNVKAFRIMTDDKLYNFVGRTAAKYIPVNEEVELELGNDQEVLVKPVLMGWEKTDLRFDNRGNISGWTIKESWEIEVQNSKEIDITLDIRRNFSGDWSMTTAAKYEKVDAAKVKFVLPLKPWEKQKFAYETVTHHGINARR